MGRIRESKSPSVAYRAPISVPPRIDPRKPTFDICKEQLVNEIVGDSRMTIYRYVIIGFQTAHKHSIFWCEYDAWDTTSKRNKGYM